MRRRPHPLLTFVYPAVDVRGPAELYGHWQDGWAVPSTIIHAFEPTTARLNLEIPPWLPFHFPVLIKANQDGRELAATEASMPGCQHLDLSVDRAGIIKLSTDQWFVPLHSGSRLTTGNSLTEST